MTNIDVIKYSTKKTIEKIKENEQNEQNAQSKESTIFKKLSLINVASKLSKRRTGNVDLNYLSWADALDILYKEFDDNSVDFKVFYNEKRDDDLPIFGNSKMGYYVKTNVTIDGITREMTLPIMDGANNPLKDDAYKYSTKYGDKTVNAINTCDINKSVMRCLVKNIALFGLGISVYTGEDLPEDEKKAPVKQYDDEKEKQSQKLIISNYLNNSANKKYIDFKDGEPNNTVRDYCNNQINNPNVKLNTLVELVEKLANMGCSL